MQVLPYGDEKLPYQKLDSSSRALFQYGNSDLTDMVIALVIIYRRQRFEIHVDRRKTEMMHYCVVKNAQTTRKKVQSFPEKNIQILQSRYRRKLSITLCRE